MAETKFDYVLAGLRDAHAMEAGTIDNLQGLIKRTGDYPQLQAQLEKHLGESKRQREEVEAQLEKVGSDASRLKDVGMKASGWVEALASPLAGDSLPKDCMAGHGFENFEIASYVSLRTAAEEAGLTELSAMCDRFIEEEREMARFFLDHLPQVTRDYMRTRRDG